MKRMLINATQQEEVRVALVDGQKLYDLDIESPEHANKKANIYKGRITRIEPSLEAAFVDYGMERHGFLPIKEIAREYYPEGTNFADHNALKTLLREGQEVIVQIEKEERGQKGAALTTYISLAGSYLVLMPNNPRAGGISRRIEGEERTELKQALESIEIPQGMGVIVRTAGVGKSSEELSWDLSILTKLWEMIKNAAERREAPFLIYQESNIALRAVRDYLRPDIGEILIDDRRVFEQIKQQIELVRPEFASRVHLYTGDIPLFSKFQIESQIESAYQREVRLPSGGAIVIDPTEALTSIDVNSAKATKGGDIEETALQTNIEAAEEIARQLRLRDIGGLIVIDFIDMTPIKNQREIETRMREAVRQDRARIQFSRISRFGLLEMSRQRLRPSLEESSAHVCPMCQGQGTVRDTSSLALSVLRLLEEEAHKNTGDVFAIAPVEVATFILNEKRAKLAEIEKRHKIKVSIIPDQHMMPPQFEVQRLLGQNAPGFYDSTTSVLEQRAQEARKAMQENILASQVGKTSQAQTQAASEPAIDQGFINDITAKAPRHPQPKKEEPQPSLLGRFFKALGSMISGGDKSEETPRKSSRGNGQNRRNTSQRRGSSQNRRPARTERPERAERSERTGDKNERAEQSRQEKSERSERTTRRQAQGQGKNTSQSQATGSSKRQQKSAEDLPARTPKNSRQRPPRPEGEPQRRRRNAEPADLSGEAPHSIARSQAIAFARERDAQGIKEQLEPEKPYEPKPLTFTESASAEGPYSELSFDQQIPARPFDDGQPLQTAGRAGGLHAAVNVDGIDGISEPAVYSVSFGMEHRARPAGEGVELAVSRYGSGFSGARDRFESQVINTAQAEAAYNDDVTDSFEEPAPTTQAETVSAAENSSSTADTDSKEYSDGAENGAYPVDPYAAARTDNAVAESAAPELAETYRSEQDKASDSDSNPYAKEQDL